ncbi:DNA polymerase III beta subunit [Dissulfuribacter thermophilus]|uniref:Beta sliding clamp n=1 Tax=Dissulfuribacter thermophilus TaxID=1156395 RepID=A0A1B9F900_9BACT|nr:DNA polymerase III subunit beta [Dissulfuribacter thermophilus]OCC16295.1 DNA polymerase III beta subunit [Dissulfuribacter thermophilus]
MLRAVVKKSLILDPLSKIQTVVDKKTTMHLLNNVLIYSEGGKLSLEATDLEISYKGTFDVEIQDEGELTVNARKLYDIIRELPTEEFLLEQLPDNWLRINIGDKGEYKIGGLPVENFPRFTFLNNGKGFELEQSHLKKMILKTVLAVATDESKYALTGLLIESDRENKVLRAVGSDSHRLNLMEVPMPEGLDSDISLIIPRKGALEIIKLLDKELTVKIETDEKFLHLDCGNEHLNIRLVDGSYPDYRAILPEERIRSVIFDRVEMINILKRISIVSPDPEVKGVKMLFTPGEVLVESMSKESSDAKEKTTINYDGEPFVTALNARYMIETLNVMDSTEIKLTINDDESPCILEGDEDKGFLALIMPMTLEEE